MNDSTKVWIAKLWAAFVAGGSASVVAALANMGTDAQDFNLSSWWGFFHILKTVVIVCLLHGLIKASGFLETNPVPPGWVMIPEQRNSTTEVVVGGRREQDPPKEPDANH